LCQKKFLQYDKQKYVTAKKNVPINDYGSDFKNL